MLEVSNLSLAYGLHRALDGVALNVGAARSSTILGANRRGQDLAAESHRWRRCVRFPGKQVSLGGRDISCTAGPRDRRKRVGARFPRGAASSAT
jgi:branched-chain amino acid transport system ATP-binding protein